VVVKIGSSSLAHPDGGLDGAAVSRVVAQVAALRQGGRPVALVSSGAVAAGIPVLGLSGRPADIPGLQVAAAVGQGRLMERYTNEFAVHDLVPGQVLLTKDVLANRAQYLHARQALERMLQVGVVPVVNENDTVAVEELRLGDNDRLAAMVSHLVGAGMLVILTDTEGLYSQDPGLGAVAELLSAVRHTDDILDELARGAGRGAFGSGGVATKIAAARMAAWSGIPTVIAPARDPDAAIRAVAGEEVGTWVEPQDARLTARKLWIAFGQPAAGAVRIDAGAAGALVQAGRSLLPAGVTEVTGDFVEGDAVEVLGPDGQLVGKGLAAMAAEALRAAAGKHSAEAGGVAIHRDDLVVLVAG
jgi:glutamate 5-kinase